MIYSTSLSKNGWKIDMFNSNKWHLEDMLMMFLFFKCILQSWSFVNYMKSVQKVVKCKYEFDIFLFLDITVKRTKYS